MDEARGRLVAINPVELEAGPGMEPELAWFYGEWLGLKQIDRAYDERRDAPVLRFRSERLELRITVVRDPVVESVDRRVQFAVPDLDAAAEQLDARRYRYRWVHGLGATDRALVLLDPIGNRVAVRCHWPPCPL